MSDSMADVLREECRTIYVEGCDDMFCFRDADELAAALAAAGFGPVDEAKAEALRRAADALSYMNTTDVFRGWRRWWWTPGHLGRLDGLIGACDYLRARAAELRQP